MILRSLFPIILNCLFVYYLTAETDASSLTWIFDRVDTIGGYAASKLRDWPTIIETSQGKAAFFDGIDDGILLNCNPMGSATDFTLEVVFRPDSNDLTGEKNQPRFIHINDVVNNNNRRVTMETRILPNQRWILDTYIKASTTIFLTQIDSLQTHISGEWHHAAIVYNEGIMKQYVDGAEQMSGSVTYLPIDSASGRISIGVRQDPRYWFKGAIRLIKVSKRALGPEEFTLPITTGVRDIGGYLTKIKLFQNYPNPFNPSTHIGFSIPNRSYVTLRIFDILGKEVGSLVNGELNAGYYNIEWNPKTGLSSGVYFINLIAGCYMDTKKLLYQK